ncbi:MAG TPA: TraM recognition domain-containing protein, partial [Opitutaceae bacterium]|nr:TraM recognition domain-containing protein [Opitutaceae bacterium]
MSNQESPPVVGWPDDHGLLLMGGDIWRIKDACEGTMIFGGTGSGKTSGSGRALARSFLAAGFGGLVLCAKPEEPALWRGYAADTGRVSDLVMFGGSEPWGFNFMRYESLRPGAGAGITENLVNLFMEVSSIASEDSHGRGGDPFWERAMKSLVRNCVDALLMAGEPVSLHAMFDVIRGAPGEPAVVSSPEWRKQSGCWRRLEIARSRARGKSWEIDCREVAAYFLGHFPTLGDKTRGSVVAMFSTLAEALMRGKMRELFCEGSTISPEDVIAGKVVVVDLPVKEWAAVGRMAAVLWKYSLQKASERRGDNGGGRGRPLFLWADECQHFASRYDSLFQATARSSRVASVYMTQNYPSLIAALGGESGGKAMTDSLLGNMGTKIFHANSDRETNQLAADLVGKRLQSLRNFGAGASLSLGGQASAGSSANRGRSEHMDYDIQPTEFSTLRKGGAENRYASEALVFQNGRRWGATGRTWQKVAFIQRTGPIEAPPHETG